MPEMRFKIQWPDGTEEICYSPSLVVKEYFTPDQSYPLDDFVARSRTALTIASDRVQAKYGMPCSLALNQLSQIERRADQFQQKATIPIAVKVIQFIE
ncbi:MSMEG_0570 family nitrogen starvation response protein [Alkalinema pantanalense CENA528]|uniref:MSMEG_0570 family nitrogen starvation response protein n=1 Tax=Alkalinema pantanalense TaxID=1620705 RepID=UPI003D7004D0